ncbi:MAG: HAD family hydrolase [Planctomycetota bacterium]
MQAPTAVLKAFLASAAMLALGACASNPLPSWNDGPAKTQITTFVDTVTDTGSDDFVQPSERIATFDNDGCLWAEQPVYFQILFAIDRINAMAADNPSWQTTEPYKSALAGDIKALAGQGHKAIGQVIAASHAGMTTEEFDAVVRDWFETARHPTTGHSYTEMVYQPMLEVLDYLRDNGFKTYIVSGGGIDFVRVYAEEVYGIPPEQVVGSSIKTGFEMRDGKPTLVKLPELNFIDDKEGKPVGIREHIGRRPIAAFGNSDGDHEMLQYTAAGEGPRLCVLVHHTDDDREWAYDRGSPIGGLDKALDDAHLRGWTVINMKTDWAQIYP